MVRLGLLGTAPEVDLALARTQFASGDLTGSATSAGAARSAWTGAADVGLGRAVSIAVLAVALVMAVILFAAWLRGRRRRGHVTMTAGDTGV
jgi:hypothetical protein